MLDERGSVQFKVRNMQQVDWFGQRGQKDDWTKAILFYREG